MSERLSRISLHGTRMTEPGVRVLVTGATGFIGARLCANLLMNRCEVVALSRNPAAAQEKVHAVTRAWEWSESVAVPDAAAQGLDAIVHLAGEPVAGRWTDAKKKAIESSRVEGTRRIVEAIAAQPANQRPLVLVSASAMGYYGDTGEREVREDDAPADDFLARVCQGWEREALAAEALGVRVVCLRIGLVLGPEGGALARMLPLFKTGLGGRIGSGEQWWSWVHQSDVVGLIEHAVRDDALHGALNAVAPQPVRQREFASTLARVLGRPAFLPTPAFALRTALGEFADEVLGSRRLSAARAIERDYTFRFPDLEGALRDLLR